MATSDEVIIERQEASFDLCATARIVLPLDHSELAARKSALRFRLFLVRSTLAGHDDPVFNAYLTLIFFEVSIKY